MSLASDLLDQASVLAALDSMKPKQASLRRAISAAYYSVLHLLIDDGARRVTANPTLHPFVAAISRAQAAHQDWALLRTSENATVFLLHSAKLLPDR